MALVTIENLSIGFRGPPLLDEVNCVIENRQRIGLLGVNGAGKSTLMKIIAGELAPDAGQCALSPGAHTERLVQEVPDNIPGTIEEVIRSGWRGKDVDSEDNDCWQAHALMDRLLTDMQLDGERIVNDLSAGLKRRVLLGKALFAQPDLLLLDEPTNHLDLAAIEWLEKFLCRWPTTLLFVTHDRQFLRNVSNRIMEIDRGNIFDWACGYDDFLVRKEQALATEEKQNALFDKRLAEEEKWIRQGVKARRTRNEGRVRALKSMRNERSDRREKLGTANLKIQEAQRSGQLVASATEVDFSYGDLQIFNGLTTTIMRGDKIGIIGPNGAGKTTLLRVMLGELPPCNGTIRLGTNLEIAYFDQLRGQLDEELTPEQTVADGYDTVKIGEISQHVLGYLREFLFTPDRARTQIRFLSGGERNRLLLAKLFTKPANVIVLDEPTNDLDTETLEMLEDRLLSYSGTLLIVSHDRAFLNNVVTSTLVFEPEGMKEYVGGYDDWIRQRKAAIANKEEAQSPKSDNKSGNTEKASTPTKKLPYKEQRELDALPAKIQKLEKAIEAIHAKMGEPEFYQGPAEPQREAQKKSTELQEELDQCFARWEELEG